MSPCDLMYGTDVRLRNDELHRVDVYISLESRKIDYLALEAKRASKTEHEIPDLKIVTFEVGGELLDARGR